jgi:signal transduction histidine kinase
VADRRDKLIEAGLALASERSLDAVLQRIVELAVELTDSRYGAIGVLGPNDRIIEFITSGVTPEERAAIGDPPEGHGILGLLIREARPLRLRNIADHPASVGFPPNHPPMTTLLGAPVVARGTVFGNIYLTEKRSPDGFEEADQEALIVLSAQAGLAIENARLIAEIERLSVLEDRERIARELHDGVIQSLFAAGMSLQGATALTDDPEAQRRIESVVTDIDRTIRDLRNYIFGLRPAILTDRRLGEAIGGLATELQARSGIVAVVDVDDRAASALSTRSTDAVQFVREALSNVGRHSGAATCRVSLRLGDGVAVLEVDDDGKGFETGSATGGSGMSNLQARARAMGGELSVESSPQGTTLRVTVPLA